MKVGDTFVIRLDEHEVGQAVIESIEDGQATLVIPATRIVMGVRTSLAAPPERTPEVDRVFGGMQETPDNTPSEAQQQVNTQQVTATEPVQQQTPVAEPDAVGNGIRSVELDSSILD